MGQHLSSPPLLKSKRHRPISAQRERLFILGTSIPQIQLWERILAGKKSCAQIDGDDFALCICTNVIFYQLIGGPVFGWLRVDGEKRQQDKSRWQNASCTDQQISPCCCSERNKVIAKKIFPPSEAATQPWKCLQWEHFLPKAHFPAGTELSLLLFPLGKAREVQGDGAEQGCWNQDLWQGQSHRDCWGWAAIYKTSQGGRKRFST